MSLLKYPILIVLLALPLGACDRTDHGATQQVDLGQRLHCNERDGIIICHPLGPAQRSSLFLRPPLKAPNGTSGPAAVIIDAGGPGVNVGPAVKKGYAGFPSAWDASYVVVLQEPWLHAKPDAACRDALNEFFAGIRRGQRPTNARLVATNCNLTAAGWREDEYAASVQAIMDQVVGQTLLVGSSFGAYRMRAVLDDLRVDAQQRPTALFDSPPDGIFNDGTEFLKGRASNIARVVTDSFVRYCQERSCSASTKHARLDALNNITSLSSNQKLAGLTAVMMNPVRNGQWLWGDDAERFVQDFEAQYSVLADAALRRKSFDSYSESWLGYFAELCPKLAGWPAPASAAQSADADLTEAGLYGYLADSHSVCRFVESQPWQFAPVTGWGGCVLTRALDIVTSVEKMDARFLLGNVVQLAESGHHPLQPGSQLDKALDGIMSGRCTGGDSGSAVELQTREYADVY